MACFTVAFISLGVFHCTVSFFFIIILHPLISLTVELFNHCPFLLPQGEDVQKVLEQWKEYKMGVPTYGAIILDETLDHVSITGQQCPIASGYLSSPSAVRLEVFLYPCRRCWFKAILPSLDGVFQREK